MFEAERSVERVEGACGALGRKRGRLCSYGLTTRLWGILGAVGGVVVTEWAGVLAGWLQRTPGCFPALTRAWRVPLRLASASAWPLWVVFEQVDGDGDE